MLAVSPAAGAEVHVAVASNFAAPAAALADAFAAATGHRAVVAVGSTGKHVAQIVHGAPFDVFLAADTTAPTRLLRLDRAVAGTDFVYAVGRLALWSADPAVVDGAGAVLGQSDFHHLAVANPRLAPYGRAAQQALESLGLWAGLRPRLVFGENIGQTFQFVASGNAELGFVALGQLRNPGAPAAGSTWLVPAELHAPIAQAAVLLREGAAARAFLEYLRGGAAAELIRRYGYEVPVP